MNKKGYANADVAFSIKKLFKVNATPLLSIKLQKLFK